MKMLPQVIGWVACAFVGLFLSVFFGLLPYRSYLKHATQNRTPNGISSLEETTLDGGEQWIFISGADQKNPVLRFLHGGPGEPAAGMSSSRKLYAELIQQFTVAHWDHEEQASHIIAMFRLIQ